LKNIAEQISVIEHQRNINADILRRYLPDNISQLPALYQKSDDQQFTSEREILYKILFDMRNDVNELKALMAAIKKDEDVDDTKLYGKPYGNVDRFTPNPLSYEVTGTSKNSMEIEDTEEILDESLLLSDKEAEMIKKALEKHDGRRRNAAQELGISERTLYRKIKEYNLE
jgi:DNA-binding NtrC family response regulator